MLQKISKTQFYSNGDYYRGAKIVRNGGEMQVIDSSTCKKFNNEAFYKSAKAGLSPVYPLRPTGQ